LVSGSPAPGHKRTHVLHCRAVQASIVARRPRHPYIPASAGLRSSYQMMRSDADQSSGECPPVSRQRCHSACRTVEKARLRRDPRPREYIGALMKVMASARIHDVESKCEHWVKSLSKHDAKAQYFCFCIKVIVDGGTSEVSVLIDGAFTVLSGLERSRALIVDAKLTMSTVSLSHRRRSPRAPDRPGALFIN
jgi:hypothetical protein